MSILTRSQIMAEVTAGRILIDPFEPKHVGVNSVDLRLGHELLIFHPNLIQLDMRIDPWMKKITIPESGFVLEPHRLYLGHTLETTHTPHHVPWIDGRSSTGRFGLMVHVTAGRGDIGFEGDWTLELVNITHLPMRIYAGARIAQITYFTTVGELDEYRGQYQGQTGPKASGLWKSFLE